MQYHNETAKFDGIFFTMSLIMLQFLMMTNVNQNDLKLTPKQLHRNQSFGKEKYFCEKSC